MLRLGYSTYGLRDQDVFESVSRLADIGYDTVELTATDGWPASHDRLDDDDRTRLVNLLREVGFPTPHVMDLDVCPRSTGEETIDRFRSTFELARDLHHDEHPAVVKTVVGGEIEEWDEQVGEIARDLLEIADVAAEYGVIFAVEPHVGTPLDEPGRAIDVMERTDHPNLGLALDVAHFPPARFDVDRVVRLCGPHAVTTHVEDTEIVDGDIEYRPAGTTDFDYEWYCKRLVDVGYDGPITGETASQIWDASDYDPWETAEFYYESLCSPVDVANRYAAASSAISDDP